MMTIQIIRNIRVHARPSLERLQLGFRLAHIAVEIVEVAKRLGFEFRVRVRGVVALVVLDVDEDAVFGGRGEEREVVGKGLDCGFGDEDVDFSFDGVEGDGVVGGVWREDRDGVAGGERVDCGLVGMGVDGVVGGVRGEGCVEVVVELGYVFVEVFAW